MDRVPLGYAEAISAAFAAIPAGIRHRLRSHFLCGVDPVFAGLHKYTDASYGRGYATTAHTTYPCHQPHLARSSRRTTIVLPIPEHPATIVHELGHVLHEQLRFEPTPRPVNRYAATNNHEAFACAFTSWLYYGQGDYPDAVTVHLLESLT